ncbi:hypothetical protein SRHO_G00115460 [Serrasalmus rhombeus]
MLNADRACGNAPLKSSRDPNSPDLVLYTTNEVVAVMNVSSVHRTQPVPSPAKSDALVCCHMGTTPQACSTGGLESCDGRLHTLRDECGVFRLVLLRRDTRNQK